METVRAQDQRAVDPEAQAWSAEGLSAGLRVSTAGSDASDEPKLSQITLRSSDDRRHASWRPAWGDQVWSGLVWTELVWAGLVWSGLSWSDLVWAGLVWSELVWAGLYPLFLHVYEHLQLHNIHVNLNAAWMLVFRDAKWLAVFYNWIKSIFIFKCLCFIDLNLVLKPRNDFEQHINHRFHLEANAY